MSLIDWRVSVLAAVVALSTPFPAMAQVQDLGVMGADGVIRSEAEAEALAAARAPVEDPILPRILLKSQKEVSAVLGKPERCSKVKWGDECFYRNSQVEIIYIKGKADWITYNDPPGVGFYPVALTYLGVKCPMDLDKISFGGGLYTWNGTCPGLHTAVLVTGAGQAPSDPDNRRLGYVYIKAVTP